MRAKGHFMIDFCHTHCKRRESCITYRERALPSLKYLFPDYSRRNLIIALLGIDGKPIPSEDHLAAELFLIERGLGVDNGVIKSPNLTLHPKMKFYHEVE